MSAAARRRTKATPERVTGSDPRLYATDPEGRIICSGKTFVGLFIEGENVSLAASEGIEVPIALGCVAYSLAKAALSEGARLVDLRDAIRDAVDNGIGRAAREWAKEPRP